jgi:hypothetical protein
VLSDVRVGIGDVTRDEVFAAAQQRGVEVRESRIDSAKLAEIYFALREARLDA